MRNQSVFVADCLAKRFLFSWAVREDIPYIRAIRLVPVVMKQKLKAEYMLALDTIVGPHVATQTPPDETGSLH